MRRTRLACAALGAAVLGTGCGGGGGTDAGPEPRPIPACARAGPAIERPDELPDGFPVPPGTRLTAVRRPFPGQVIVDGFLPPTLETARKFFTERLPDAGYRLGRGDAERGEVEALFTGHGVRGGWRVRELRDCPALTLTLVLIRQP